MIDTLWKLGVIVPFAVCFGAQPASAVIEQPLCVVDQADVGNFHDTLQAQAPFLAALKPAAPFSTADYHLGGYGNKNRPASRGVGGRGGSMAVAMPGAPGSMPNTMPGGAPTAAAGGFGMGGFSFRQKLVDALEASGGLQATPTGMLRLNGDGTYNLGPVYAGLGLTMGTQIGTASAAGARFGPAGTVGAAGASGAVGATGYSRKLASGGGAASAATGAALATVGRPTSIFRLGSGANSAAAEITVGTRGKLGFLNTSLDWRYSGDDYGTFNGSVGIPF